MKIVQSELKAKRKRLEELKVELKAEFFGIDRCIDKIVESIKTWYLLPDIITRPVIVNLWGMTGVGKTALVRSLVEKIGFSGKFVEIQMDGFSNGGEYRSPTSVCSILQSSSIDEKCTGVILLDEFQRFKTVDNNGEDIKLERYQDVWMLLSDGKFSSDHSFLENLEQSLASIEYDNDSKEYRKLEEAHNIKQKALNEIKQEPRAMRPETTSKENLPGKQLESVQIIPFSQKRKYSIYPWEAKNIKKTLRLSESITDIMTWDALKVASLIREHFDSKGDEAVDYSKCLIFIAGNIDEAFSMSSSVEDCDTDADVFFEHTNTIGVPQIKSALTKRFKPEQIGRLGNNHIVYPSLNRDAYMSIIRRACAEYVDEVHKICNVRFEIEENVIKEIYENSVYPSQGTRPVFTSVHKLFGSPLSDGILWAMENSLRKVKIGLDVKSSCLLFKTKSKVKKQFVEFELRQNKNRRSDDYNTLVAVHEAGHAILYAKLFKRSPLEIVASVASFNGGYNSFSTLPCLSKTDILNRIVVSFGGIVAEEMIFGADFRSDGCASDISLATIDAGRYVRRYAMDHFNSFIFKDTDCNHNHGVEESNSNIEAIVTEQKNRAQTIMASETELLLTLAKKLLVNKKLNRLQAREFFESHGLEFDDYKTEGKDDRLSAHYNELFEKRLSEREGN